MQFDVVALFPEIVEASASHGVVARARRDGLITLRLHDLRSFGEGPHRRVDDYPFGGGPGMVMKPEPIFAAVEDVRRRFPCERERTVLLGPQGKVLDHAGALRLSRYDRLTLICGRYEGVDERVKESLVDEELSIGDYVLSGGEPAAAVLVDVIARLVPGVVGNAESVLADSFALGVLSAPQYTRPAEFRGMTVPDVLTSGDHAQVDEWRRRMALRNTDRRRPDLVEMERESGAGGGPLPGRGPSGGAGEG